MRSDITHTKQTLTKTLISSVSIDYSAVFNLENTWNAGSAVFPAIKFEKVLTTSSSIEIVTTKQALTHKREMTNK